MNSLNPKNGEALFCEDCPLKNRAEGRIAQIAKPTVVWKRGLRGAIFGASAVLDKDYGVLLDENNNPSAPLWLPPNWPLERIQEALADCESPLYEARGLPVFKRDIVICRSL